MPGLRPSARATSSRKCIALAYQSGVAKSTTRTPGSSAAAGLGRERRPTGGARDPPEDVQLGAGAQADPVQDGQADGDADALLHADQDHGEQRHGGQAELEEVEAGDGTQVAPA